MAKAKQHKAGRKEWLAYIKALKAWVALVYPPAGTGAQLDEGSQPPPPPPPKPGHN